MTSLSSLTIADAREMLRAGDTTSRQITEDCLTAIDEAAGLNAFVTVTADKAPLLHGGGAQPGGLAYPRRLHAAL
jgi:Asp-tRNA(Asn)/Glu-tRNA(Gln) amidotransferase A subunit family amidase